MTETNLNSETLPEAQSVEEQDKPTQPTAEGEKWDEARAMETIKKLRDIEKQYKKEKQELDRLKADEAKRKEAEMSDIEKANKRAADLEAELKKERTERMRLKVASKYQLPEALANRLQGDTEEDLETDAKSLAELLPKQTEQQKKNPLLKTNDIADGQKGKTDAQRRAEIYNRGVNPFDTQTVLSNGGGVFFVDKK